MKTVIRSALQVASDKLEGRHVRCTHDEETHLLNCITDIRLSEGKILKSPGKTAIGSLDPK